MKETFNIDDVAQITQFSTRTIRSYIADGVLVGDKSSGSWQFTAEQVVAFQQNKAVLQTIRSKKNAIVYGFMLDEPQDDDKMCVVLDLPSDKENHASTFFCKYLADFQPENVEIRFSSDKLGSGTRVILSGADSDVMKMLNRYYAER